MNRDFCTQLGITVDHTHTGEEVLATGGGPGSERIHGFFPNIYLFHVMLDAYGWAEDGAIAHRQAR